MKKMVLFLAVLLVLIGSVFAQGNGLANGLVNSEKVAKLSTVKGLENAIVQAKSQERVQHLEKVMNKIQEKRMEQLRKLSGLTFEEKENGEISATGTTDAKLLGFLKMKKNVQYEVSEDGFVKYRQGPFDFLFKFENEVIQ